MILEPAHRPQHSAPAPHQPPTLAIPPSEVPQFIHPLAHALNRIMIE